jgi:hypothetical protein
MTRVFDLTSSGGMSSFRPDRKMLPEILGWDIIKIPRNQEMRSKLLGIENPKEVI